MYFLPLFIELLFNGTVGPKVGDPAPDFEVPATNGKTVKLSDCKGSWVVLYFYPKAFTPGCTAESCSLRDSYTDIQQMNAVILGVSLDDIETQQKFKDKHRLQFELLSDQDKNIARAFDVLGLMGVYAQRKTFIIDPEGKIAYIFDKVNTSKHDVEVKEVLDKLQHNP
ncbi:peroxiredoxin [Candidatus Poribacteria bacterium]|nr:peroxiredoxin [Candidatus Poribacteria bacterium]